MATITERFAISPNVYSTSDEDGSTILDIENDKIYSLIGVSSLIWSRLAASSRGLGLHSIVDYVSERFQEVPRHTIEADTRRLIDSLRHKRVVVAENQSNFLKSSLSRSIGRGLLILIRPWTSVLWQLRLHTFTAFLGIGVVNLVLRLCGFRRLCEAVKTWPVSRIVSGKPAHEEICAAVKKAASWYPRQSVCLQRSAVATCLLRQSGIEAELVIGCRRIPFGAHAWVEIGGEVANDKKQVQDFYKVLSRF